MSGFRLALICAGLAGAGVASSAFAAERGTAQPESWQVRADWDSYQAGEVLTLDVVAPVDLVVTNREATYALRREALLQVPAVFRFYSGAAGLAETALRQACAEAKSRFADGLELAAKRRTLDAQTVRHPSFDRFVEWFAAQHPRFPITPRLARLWATQSSDEPVLALWAGHLNQAMSQCLHDEELGSEMTSGPASVRIVPVDRKSDVVSVKQVENRGVDVPRGNVLPLEHARQRMVSHAAKELGEESDRIGSFLADFLQANCFPEVALTRLMRGDRIRELYQVDRYAAGQVIGAQGQRADARILAALEVMSARQKAEQERAARAADSQVGSEGTGLEVAASERGWFSRPAPVLSWRRWVGDPRRFEVNAWIWLWGLAALGVALTFTLAWLVRRQRRGKLAAAAAEVVPDDNYTVIMNPQRNETIFLPASSVARPVSSDPPAGEEAPASDQAAPEPMAVSAEQFWRQRSAEAEHRADEILRMVRAGLAPQLARQMMSKLVQELVSQRTRWLQTQEIAEHDLREIERRFLRSHAQLQDRLRAFEKRTDELEQALATKTEENTELIKAHIALTQQKLQPEKGDEELIWN